MLNKKLVLLAIFLITLLAVSAVSAADDINETLTVDNTEEAPIDTFLDENIVDATDEVAEDYNHDVLSYYGDIDDNTFRSNVLWHLHKDASDYDVVDVWWIDDYFGEKNDAHPIDGNFTLRVTNSHGDSKVYYKDYGDSEECYKTYYRDELGRHLSHITWKLGELDMINEIGFYTLDVNYNSMPIVQNSNFQLTQMIYEIIDIYTESFDVEYIGFKWDGLYLDYPYDAYRIYGDRNKSHFEVSVNGVNREGKLTPKPIAWSLEDLGIYSPGFYLIHTKTFDNDNNLVEEFRWNLSVCDIEDVYRVMWNLEGIHDYDCENPVIYLYCPSDSHENINVKVNEVEVCNKDSTPGEWLGFTLQDLGLLKNDVYQIMFNDWNHIGRVREIYLNVNHYVDENSNESGPENPDSPMDNDNATPTVPVDNITNQTDPTDNNSTNANDNATGVDPVIKATNATVTYLAGKYYTIKVYGDDGKLSDGAKLVITVKGKTFKVLTTKDGVAKFKVTSLPGTYVMNITSLGKSVTKTLTVKHLVTLKKVTVKKSAKKVTLQATLGKVNGKYLKNKKVTFKFNGKTYKAKTNKKGVAEVTIKSSVLKKLKVGKKVTYQATYSKDTVKKTAKVKK